MNKYIWISLVSGLLLISTARAQNLYFDPNNTGSAAGGSGSFSTGSFYNGTGDQTFTSGDNAIFNGAAGTVSVETPVNPTYLEVGVTSGTETFGTAGANAQVSFPAGFPFPPDNVFYLNPINIDAGTENVVFNSNLNLNIYNQYYNNLNVNSASSGTVTINGGVTFTNDTTDATDSTGNSVGEPNMNIDENAAGGNAILNSAVTTVNTPGSQPIQNGNIPYLGFAVGSANPNGTLTLTKNSSFTDSGLVVLSGTVLDQGATFIQGSDGYADVRVNNGGQYLTDGPGAVSNVDIQNGGGALIVGGATADSTTINGLVILYGVGSPTLTAVAGGTVTFTNAIGEYVTYTDPSQVAPIEKIGAGTVILTNNGNALQNIGTFGGNTEIQNGTLLLNTPNALSKAGTTLTIDNVATSALSPSQTYATLGGTGTFAGLVSAAGANSVIAPGNPSSIGTLTLEGGLTTTGSNGLTLDFKLNGNLAIPGLAEAGVDNDLLDIGGGSLSLNGPITVNITSLDGSVATGTPYTFIEGPFADFSASTNPTFDINAPAGYAVSSYSFDTSLNTFSVVFEAVPEPSTYAMLLGGLALLGFRLRRRAC